MKEAILYGRMSVKNRRNAKTRKSAFYYLYEVIVKGKDAKPLGEMFLRTR
jgi:hypothetical protein